MTAVAARRPLGANRPATQAALGTIFALATIAAVPSRAWASEPAGLPRFGLMLDAGIPDGANASFVYRPSAALRLHAGGSYNLVNPGIRAGASWSLFSRFIAPTLVVEGGRSFRGDPRTVAEVPVQEISYDYVSAHGGLEVGMRRATFYLHAGRTYVRSVLDPEDTDAVRFPEDIRASGWIVSARVGLIVYLF